MMGESVTKARVAEGDEATAIIDAALHAMSVRGGLRTDIDSSIMPGCLRFVDGERPVLLFPNEIARTEFFVTIGAEPLELS